MYNGSAGGRASGRLQRERALKKYYEDPNRCLYCDSVITVDEGQKVNKVRKKKFCNHSHAARYNNAAYPKRRRLRPREGPCVKCGCIITYAISARGAVIPRSYCDKCLEIVWAEHAYMRLYGTDSVTRVVNCTKGELRKRFGKSSFRTRIALHAKKVFARSGRSKVCTVCGYSVHVHICHIRAVADFPDDALLSEINSEENFIVLCPNHHWEFDHNILASKFLRGRRTGTAT